MFPADLQKFFSWMVPAFLGFLGICSIRAWRSEVAVRTRWHLISGILAIGYAVLTITNLSLQGTAYGNIPFSAGPTGYGPRSVAVDFVAQCCLFAAVSGWALASLSFGNTRTPLAQVKRPVVVFAAAAALVGLVLRLFG